MSDTHNHNEEHKDDAHSHDDGHNHAHDDHFNRLFGGRAEIIFAALCGLCLIAGWLCKAVISKRIITLSAISSP